MSDISFEDFNRWNVDNIREFLRERGLKTSGKKAELVALAYSANQLGIKKKTYPMTEEKIR